MAYSHLLLGGATSQAQPAVRRIAVSDLMEALGKGVADFSAMPTHAIFLCIFYPLIGLVLARLAFGYSILPLLYPLASGFALVGPIAALGLYELSRRREAGLKASASHAFDVLQSSSIGAIAALGLLLFVIFLVWVAIADAIYVANFGYAQPASISQFLHDIFTTRPGWNLILVGNAVGFFFAILVLTISAVSFPLLLDRDVGAAGALLTSLRVVLKNPVTDGGVGSDRRGAAGDRIAAVLPRADRGRAGARPCDLASVPQGRRCRRERAPGTSVCRPPAGVMPPTSRPICSLGPASASGPGPARLS